MRPPACAAPGPGFAAGMCAHSIRTVAACALAAGALAACASTGRSAAERAAAEPASPASAATPAPEVPASAEAAGNPWRAPAREVLVHHCGQCHRGDLPTAVPRALQVFDLTRRAWDERMLPPQYDALLTRVRESSAFGSDEVASIEAFVRCARDADCAPR